MALHEKVKISHIIQELYIYLLEHNITTIQTNTTITSNEAIISVTLPIDKRYIAQEIEENLVCARDAFLEEYSWEITVEDNYSSELIQLGSQLDSFDVEETNDHIILHFHRQLKKE
jgi:hypothetical protein